MTDPARRIAPAAERNLAPILHALQHHAPSHGRALEIASGSGQQIIHFAKARPGLTWQASDLDPENLASIAAWAQFAPAPNLLPPIVLDGAQPGWAQGHAGQSLILMVNVLHLISTPAAATLLHECSTALAPNGRLLIYGPFLRAGRATSLGDAQFDADLRARDPAIGYKDLTWVQAELATHGLRLQIEDMPANNLMLIAQIP
jgi:SAM-dependent methyltransferase